MLVRLSRSFLHNKEFIFTSSVSLFSSTSKTMRSVSTLLSLRSFLAVVFSTFAVVCLYGLTGSTSANNSTAALAPHTVSVVSTSATPGSVATVSIELESAGDEVAGSFTINFDPAKLSPATPFVQLGTGVPAGTALTVNPNQTASGRVGMLVDSTNSFTTSPPNRQIVTIRFNVAAGAPGGATPITFGSTPTPRSFSDALGNPLTMTYVDGSVNIQAAAPPVSVSGRVTNPSGQGVRNALVSIVDASNNRYIASTSQFGFYTITGVPSGVNYTIGVSSRRWRFNSINMVISTDLTNMDFVGQE